MKFHPYSLKVSANVKIARQCFEIFGGGEMSQIPPPPVAHMQSTMCFALFAWFTRAALSAGIAKTATDKACNEYKTLGQLGLVYV